MRTQWKLSDIGTRLNGEIYGNGDITISTLAIDSRTIALSDSTLFVALAGDQHDGHDYLNELYHGGIRAFLVSKPPDINAFPGA